MAKSPIVLPLSTTFLQRFSQYFSTDGGLNPIGRRTESDWTANANGGTLRGCTCLKCTNRARNAPTKQVVHQQSKWCTSKGSSAPTKEVVQNNGMVHLRQVPPLKAPPKSTP